MSTLPIDAVPMECYLRNSTEFGEFLSKNLSLSQGVVDGIVGATFNLSDVNYTT